MTVEAGRAVPEAPAGYVLDEQVGFILRQVAQRHGLVFTAAFGDLTAMQWAVIAKLAEIGECSQNLLGRLVAMDVATIKGVIERLSRRDLVTTRPDPGDRRRLLLRLSAAGAAAYGQLEDEAARVTRETLAPLTPREQATFLTLLRRLR